MDFDELLTAAEQAPTPSKVVRVCIDPTVAVKRAGLLAAVDEAKKADAKAEAGDQRLGAAVEKVTARTDAAVAELEAFDTEVVKSLITLKFTRLEGQIWALLTSAFPMRIDVALDRHYGYDYDAVTEAAARRSGVRVDDDGEHPLTDEQWQRLWKILSGHDVGQIRDAVWTLNEYEPEQHIDALVKDFGAA
jgi:hypothetical protein